MKNEFNLLFEGILSELDGGEAVVAVAPEEDTEIVISPEMTTQQIADDIIKQLKGLRKIARENDFDSKIYYRARNIQKLAEKLGAVAEPLDDQPLTF